MMAEVRTSEWIALAYYAYLGGLAVLQLAGNGRPAPAYRRASRSVLVLSALMISVILALTLSKGSPAAIARDWMPLVYLLVGYWLPAQLVRTTSPRLERALLNESEGVWGQRLGKLQQARAARRSRVLGACVLFCYPLMPIGFAWLLLLGLRDEADRFWTAVLLAGFLSYGPLPWLPTRAPRAIAEEPVPLRSSIRTLNLLVLDRASVQLNTFPSGHTATAFAAALAVGVHSPPAGATLGFIALGIAAGSVVGRYHYVADAIAGAVVAIAAFAISRLV